VKEGTKITYQIIAADGESPMPLRDINSLEETRKDLNFFRGKYPNGKFTIWEEQTVTAKLSY